MALQVQEKSVRNSVAMSPDPEKSDNKAERAKCSIGIRVEPSKIHWAVVTGSNAQPILEGADALPAPKSWAEAAALQWYRNQVIQLIERYNPSSAVIRDTEVSGHLQVQSLQTRCRIEGVVIEAAQSKALVVTSGRLNKMSALLDTKSAKKYITSDEFRGVDLSRYAPYTREAILVAVAGLEEHT